MITYIFEDLKEKLDAFIWKHTRDLYDNNVEKKIEKIRQTDQATIDNLVDRWSKAFTQVILTRQLDHAGKS